MFKTTFFTTLITDQVGDHIPSLTEEEIQRVAEEVKDYMTIYLCQIQADPLNSELVLEFKRIFTNLTLMEEDKGTKRKTPLLYDDLLRTKVNERFPKRLLVEGEGGVGKTTFCAKIAWDWINGKGYQDFKLVLVILLRKTEGKTVGEIVKSYLSDNNPVTAKQLDKHILSNPDDIFLVLDGLDEFAVDLDSNQQIGLITLNRLFKSGTVLITSRQWRSDEIRMNADLRKVFAFIAVEGFSAENLSSYITKFFHPDAASSEDLNRFISNNDVIRENMAPYPIYTAMLCIMWKEFDGERREAMSKLQTFSQLFNQMIDFLVDHHLSKHIPSSGIVEGKLGEHCSDIRPHLIHIGRIAFQGLLKRRLVFTEEEFQSYPESIDVGCKVGVLTREKKNLPRRDRRNTPNSVVQSVQFPHKLFQEYLSGMYLASLYKSNRNEYDMLIANITREALEYRYLLYFTSAQQKEVGLDIISRLIEAKTKRTQGRIDDDFIVDVAYESQDQAVAKAVADHLSTTSRKTLKIFTRMQAHTVSGHTFILNHREVDDLIIEKPCGRTASEDLAEFMCSSRSLRSVTIDLTRVTGTMHDFYSVLANKAVDSKVSINLCIIHVVVCLVHHSLKKRMPYSVRIIVFLVS
ncbi:NACHT, LRR and PYD domains-containing protein 3-like [Strongylocentrotus purpuratus]|uniref:NACHT domain-containing protein n=1 Tax=Strongylocentrotus purpuratus TaxID=7668 RepID=A0A7M7PGV9_STRPU|nr:NACHT, LRR and PYD domains-containing protein 3-like [Strongylocentrotus purpuratus]